MRIRVPVLVLVLPCLLVVFFFVAWRLGRCALCSPNPSYPSLKHRGSLTANTLISHPSTSVPEVKVERGACFGKRSSSLHRRRGEAAVRIRVLVLVLLFACLWRYAMHVRVNVLVLVSRRFPVCCLETRPSCTLCSLSPSYPSLKYSGSPTSSPYARLIVLDEEVRRVVLVSRYCVEGFIGGEDVLGHARPRPRARSLLCFPFSWLDR
ncbi:hypothetical protein B0H34DRAFT_288860 [Crassisporium funariophilum]|nr:hypothetical protein B0H34DRAFT_288860 [Crassisporium funariophilum]